jgi:hypothetical protein
MTSGLAHDFGNLLTIILGLQGPAGPRRSAPAQAEDVQATLAAARRGVHAAGRHRQALTEREQHPQPVDLADAAGRAGGDDPAHAGRGFRPDTDLPDSRALMLDPGALQDAC